MGRPKYEVADIFRLGGQAYRSKHKLSKPQHKAMRAIEQCRTAALGGHIDACDECGHVRISYNSCRNRHCPKCQPCGITAIKLPCAYSTGPGLSAGSLAGSAAGGAIASGVFSHSFYSPGGGSRCSTLQRAAVIWNVIPRSVGSLIDAVCRQALPGRPAWDGSHLA